MNDPTIGLPSEAGSSYLELRDVVGGSNLSQPLPGTTSSPAAAVAGMDNPPLIRPSGKRSDRTNAKKGAPKLWEISHKYHCPIIGTCLHVDELRRLAEKIDDWATTPLSDYELHVSFVGAAETKNKVSIATQKRMDRKYAANIRQFSRAKTVEALEELWREAVARGDVAGALWALMSHPRADHSVRAMAYEDVHMLSHQIGAGHCAEARALADSRARLATLERDRAQEVRRYEQRLASRDRLLVAHKEQLAKANEALRRLQRAKSHGAVAACGTASPVKDERVAELEAEVNRLHARYERVAREERRLRAEHRDAIERIGQLSADLEEQQAAVAALERVLADREHGNDDGDGANCAAGGACRACLDLQGRRILCIGGRGTLADHYRQLVSRCNGELVRHDGGLEDSHHRLESMMAAADAVVCPADFVSHNAYYRAKRFCKQHAKPCILLRSSGISSFAKALEQLAA